MRRQNFSLSEESEVLSYLDAGKYPKKIKSLRNCLCRSKQGYHCFVGFSTEPEVAGRNDVGYYCEVRRLPKTG